MPYQLTTTNQNSKLALNKAKKLMNITNALLSKKSELVDDSWIERLWNKRATKRDRESY